LTVLSVVVILCTILIVHAYSTILLASKKRAYIVEPGSLNMTLVVSYVTNSTKPLKTNVTVLLCDIFSFYCTSSSKKVTLYPNKSEIVHITVTVPYPSLFIALGQVSSTASLLAKVICVRDVKKDIVSYGDFLIADVSPPTNYTFSMFVKDAEYVIRWYLSHGIRIAPPCLGPPFVIMTYNLRVLGSGVLGVTMPQFLVLRNGTSIGCVWVVAVNSSMMAPPQLSIKDVVAHELFHSAQTYYMRNSTFLQYWRENWWTIEGGAIAAPYYVWNRTLFLSLLGWSRIWFYYRWYRYDPAWAWYVLYERCMRICMRSHGTWGACDSYCGDLSYLSYYIYAPLMWYIFDKEGLNSHTMQIIYGSPSPSASLFVQNLTYSAYRLFLRGFPPYPNLKIRPIYMNTTSGTFYVWYRAPLYIHPNIAEGHYRLYTNTHSIVAYLYQTDADTIVRIGNGSLVKVEKSTIILVLPKLEKEPLQYAIEQKIIPFKIAMLRSLVDCRIVLRTPTSFVIGKTQNIKIYLVNCTLMNGTITIIDENSSLLRIINVGTVRLSEGNVNVIYHNSTEVSLRIRLDKLVHKLLIGYITVHTYRKGTVNIETKYILSSTITGENISKTYVVTVSAMKVLACDFNRDGRIDVGDIVLGLRYLRENVSPPVPCDLNHNGRFDVGDIVLLLKYLAW